MTPDFGLFVIWSAADHLRSQVLRVLADRFEIRGVHRITWSADRVSENFGRFYRSTRLMPPFHTYFEHQKGSGPFTLVTVLDHQPVFDRRETNRGVRLVNTRLFDAKQDFRRWTELPKVIHGTETLEEARRDIYMLLGMAPEEYLTARPSSWQGDIQHHARDVTGARGWASLRGAFDALNALLPYVVLRNFEGLPDSHVVGDHDDVDLLVDDYREAVRILNARPVLGLVPRWGGRFHVSVAGKRTIFDIRFVGDGYFDGQWQRDVLQRRCLSNSGVYVPCQRDYFETLAYHALAHKRRLSRDYSRRLTAMAIAEGLDGWTPERLGAPKEARLLLDALVQGNGRAHVKPKDVTVFYNFAVVGWNAAWIRRKLAGVRRKAAVKWWQIKALVTRTVMEARYGVVRRFPVVRRWRRLPAMS
jgi:hypothetical protein